MKVNLKKGIALVLSFGMITGLLPVMPNAMITVQAEEGTDRSTGSIPSVTAFATKDDLMNVFDLDGENDTVGKLVFGKNENSKPQEWYIAGKDNGVNNGQNNVAIFAASDIMAGQDFEDDRDANKEYTSLWKCQYPEGTSIDEVYPNHYGASDLRSALQSFATNKNYFTETEQELMNPTTVITTDRANGDGDGAYLTYKTTDILYALKDDYDDDQKLRAGSDDSKVIAMNLYCNSGYWFWLRSPDVFDKDFALVANLGSYIYYYNVDIGGAVRPASNLNLSNVLFSSAATAVSSDSSTAVVAGMIAEDNAMTLRLDGSDKTMGNVIYDGEKGQILALRDQNTGKDTTVSLVVQGNDGTKDWYYSKVIDEKELISTDEIMTTLLGNGITVSNISLADCKIWLETTDDNVTYAKMATKVKITGVPPILPVNHTFTEYYTAETVLTSEELGTQATVSFEDGNTIPVDVKWSAANADGSEYNATPSVSNTFKWYAFVENFKFEEGTVTITNKAYTDVVITPANATIPFDGNVIDVSKYFKIDTNAGTPTYTIESKTGEGTLEGTMLTVTRTGEFNIKVNTAANGIYGTGEATATLTVAEGTITSSATGYTGTYDGKSHGIAVTVTNPADAKISYSTDGTNYSATNPQFTDIGTYTVYYKIEKENYTTVEGSQTVTICADEQSTVGDNSQIGNNESGNIGDGDAGNENAGNGDNESFISGYTSVEATEQKLTSANTDKGDVTGSKFSTLRLKATGKNKSIKLTWTKVKGADGYIIYGAKCGNSMKKIKTIKGNTKVSYTQKKLKKGTYYKYIVVAYKTINGKKCTIATSKSAHAVTNGGKCANPTKVSVKKAKMTIKKGKKQTIKASYTIPKGKKFKTHIAKFRYESSNPKVATVSKKGVVTGKKKGTAYIYVYAQNGVYKKVKVTVK